MWLFACVLHQHKTRLLAYYHTFELHQTHLFSVQLPYQFAPDYNIKTEYIISDTYRLMHSAFKSSHHYLVVGGVCVGFEVCVSVGVAVCVCVVEVLLLRDVLEVLVIRVNPNPLALRLGSSISTSP